MADGRSTRDNGEEPPPSAAELEQTTYVTFADMDASPTKAWLVANRDEAKETLL